MDSFGLMDYNARYHDPLARDRNGYTSNNPIIYVDTTGHVQDCACGGDGTLQYLADMQVKTSNEKANVLYDVAIGAGLFPESI